ncbi:hypothetical protein [Metabacillus sp. RGM 3146]|uniref:hypothetical protein n=1 Tax=Metabacillus sp. RGM 3146 TaxID=3401092 RepID=UPI003B991BDB
MNSFELIGYSEPEGQLYFLNQSEPCLLQLFMLFQTSNGIALSVFHHEKLKFEEATILYQQEELQSWYADLRNSIYSL